MTKYQIISADSHLELSPDCWTSRVSAKYREYVPRLLRLENGDEGMAVGNQPLSLLGLSLTGKPYPEHTPIAKRFTGCPGTGGPEQRLREQDQDGINAEVLFLGNHNINAFHRVKDPEAYKAVTHAYNGYLGEEYCAIDRDRLIGMGVIPDTGIDDAMTELEHCHNVGLKGVALDAFPSGRGYPSPTDDIFWSTALELNLPVTVHITMRSERTKEDPPFIYKRNLPRGYTGAAGDFIGLLSRHIALSLNVVQMIMAGVFDRFPKFKIFFAETQISWIPHFMELLDDRYERNRYWAAELLGFEELARKPSDYIREHCYWGFLRNPLGVRLRHEIGINRIMWGSDFPHSVGDWPHSQRVIMENFSEVPENEIYPAVAGNAVEFFHLDT